MIIPEKLKNREFRFVCIKTKTKIPYEFNWQHINNYVFFHHKIRSSSNAGILCGKGGLIVLDIDKKELVEEFDKKIPDTFSVKTGSGKRHYYFICNEEFDKSYYVLKDGCGELRVKNSQVLIPESIHPSGDKYEVFNNIDIKTITKDELLTLLEGYLNVINNNYTDTTRSGQDWREVCQMIEAGYNYDECDAEMKLIDHSKWIEEELEYRLGTYCNALQTIKLKERAKSI